MVIVKMFFQIVKRAIQRNEAKKGGKALRQ